MKKLLYPALCFVAGAILAGSVVMVIDNDPIGHWAAGREAQKIIKVCKERRIYNRKYPYADAVYWTRKHAAQFELDRKLIYSIIIRESEFNPKAKNINNNKTEDRGLLQINSIWNGVIMSDTILSAMFGGRTNKRLQVEDFIYEIEHNIFIGCYILKHKLTTTKNLRAGITRYNGSGYYAEVYADAVLDIFAQVCKEW